MKPTLLIEPRIWDIPELVVTFTLSNAATIPVIPYTGWASPGLSGAIASIPFLLPGHTPHYYRDRRRSGLALTIPREERDHIDLSWMLVRKDIFTLEPLTSEAITCEKQVVSHMINGICKWAGEEGIMSIFARIPDESPHKQAFETNGFKCAVRENTYGTLKPNIPRPTKIPGLRVQERRDAWNIHQLYKATTPISVQQAENISSRTWALPGHRWGIGVAKRDLPHYFIVDNGSEVLGQLKISPDDKGPHRLDLMVSSNNPKLCKALLDFGLSVLQDHGPRSVLTLARDHDTSLLQVLNQNAFLPIYTRLLMVRHLGIRFQNSLPGSIVTRVAN